MAANISERENYDEFSYLFESNFEKIFILPASEKDLENISNHRNVKDLEMLLHSCILGDIHVIKNYFVSDSKNLLDVNSENCNGASLLHTAIINDHLDIVEYLIIWLNANIKLKNSHYGAPIFTACECKCTKILKFLISRRVNIEKRNNISETPIIYAARCKNINAVKVLIERGADYNIETLQGKNIFDYLTGKNAKSVKRFITYIEDSHANIKPCKH